MIATTLQSQTYGMPKLLRTGVEQRSSLKPVTLCARHKRAPFCSVRATSEPKEILKQVASTVAAISIGIIPMTGGPSYAALDTSTKEKGLAAKIEGSDITNEDQKAVLDKLENKILPEAKSMLGKVGKGEGSNYPSSVAKELDTVEQEVKGLIRQANEGGDMSNVKSAASGIEQQINALKAIVGFD